MHSQKGCRPLVYCGAPQTRAFKALGFDIQAREDAPPHFLGPGRAEDWRKRCGGVEGMVLNTCGVTSESRRPGGGVESPC